MSRPAIVTTLRNADPVVDFYIDYHLAIGFCHFILFFDDPEDISLPRIEQRPEVTAIPNDEALQLEWRDTMGYAEVKDKLVDHKHSVPAKQRLNTEIGIDIALKAGYDWLLHIDIDELFYCRSMRADEYFDKLAAEGADNVAFLNYEAMPEKLDIENYFTEVTLFKRNPQFFGRRAFAKLENDLIKQSSLFPDGFFLKYMSGKSAARVNRSLYPVDLGKGSCHRFVHIDKPDAGPRIADEDAVVLHFPLCGFDQFINVYKMLGPNWSIRRDVTRNAHRTVMAGDNAEAEAYYRKYVMCDDPGEAARLLECGLLRRIEDIPARAQGQRTPIPA